MKIRITFSVKTEKEHGYQTVRLSKMNSLQFRLIYFSDKNLRFTAFMFRSIHGNGRIINNLNIASHANDMSRPFLLQTFLSKVTTSLICFTINTLNVLHQYDWTFAENKVLKGLLSTFEFI